MAIQSVTASIQQATAQTSSSIRGTTASITSGLRQNVGGVFDTVTGGLTQFNNDFGNLLKPVSSFLGETLATLTGVAADPLGSIALLPRSIASLIEKVNPQFAANLEGTFKKYKLDSLVHLPGQILGSVRNLLTLVDAVLSFPVIILQDIYNGLMEIMDFISDLVDGFFSFIYNFLFGPDGILDSILPVAQILAFINEVSALASEIGGIAGTFLGSNPITGFTNQIQTYSGQLGSFLQNPFDALFAYAPPQVSQGLYLIRNPQQMINSVLPPQLSELFSKISSATGFGFNGNMGYGFASVLNGLRGGVLSSILSNFSAQYPILTPLLGLVNGNSQIQGSSNSLFTSPVNSNLKTSVGGFVQPQQIPDPVLPNSVSRQNVTTGLQGWNAFANTPQSKPWQTQSTTICWVAREVYGINSIKWVMFRGWLLTSAPNWLLDSYIKYGEKFANWISNKPFIKSIIRKLMDQAIKSHKYI
jgi:hypothetical protein